MKLSIIIPTYNEEEYLPNILESIKRQNFKEDFEVIIPREESYGVHIEYEYLGKFGDCVDLNTITDTFYVYPPRDSKFSVTKISLATEELYKNYWENKK